MRIPSSSSILLSGINPVSLALASILSTCGVKVLVVDEWKPITSGVEEIIIDNYSFELLQHIGFELETNMKPRINAAYFVKQSLKVLATNLCSVIWDTQVLSKPKASSQIYRLKHEDEIFEHQSQYFYNTHDLLTNQTHSILNFRNIFALAWRLIGILNKNLDQKILESYPKEVDLLKEQFDIINGSKKQFHKVIQQLFSSKKRELNLVDSKISLHLSQHRNIEAGDLLPDLNFYDEQLKTESSLYKWCNYRHFSVFMFGYLTPSHLFTIAKWLQLNYAVQLFYLPPSERNQPVFDTFQILTGERKTLIIRPDRYIGLISDSIDIDIIDNYLKSIIMMKTKDPLQPKDAKGLNN
jgi:hypothetical protein